MRSTHAAAAALSAALLVISAAPASAAEADQHCWYDLETGLSGCHDTYAKVLDDLSAAGEVAVATSYGSDGALVGTASGGVVALASVALGTVYEDLNYGGSSYTFTASSGCDSNADVDWQLSSMPSGWNDRVSSFKSFGQCATRIWADTGYSGSSYGFVANSTYVGSTMNDQASSIQWN
ncbi:MAG: hypothetical protein AB7G36_05385 [Candidatus Nanopelagicales bacterium]